MVVTRRGEIEFPTTLVAGSEVKARRSGVTERAVELIRKHASEVSVDLDEYYLQIDLVRKDDINIPVVVR